VTSMDRNLVRSMNRQMDVSQAGGPEKKARVFG